MQKNDRLQARGKSLNLIYDGHARETTSFRRDAACAKGCAYCCTDAGSIDGTTLEGLVIFDQIKKMPRARQASLKKALKRDMKKREPAPHPPAHF